MSPFRTVCTVVAVFDVCEEDGALRRRVCPINTRSLRSPLYFFSCATVSLYREAIFERTSPFRTLYEVGVVEPEDLDFLWVEELERLDASALAAASERGIVIRMPG